MTIVKIIIDIETDSVGNAAVRQIRVEPGEKSSPQTASSHSQIDWKNAVKRFTSELSSNDGRVVKTLFEARAKGEVTLRDDLMRLLGFEQLLQWNGVGAWITRKWQKATGIPKSPLVFATREAKANDYRIEFSPDVPEEALKQMSLELGI